MQAIKFMRDLIHKFEISPPNTYTEMKEEQARQFFQSGNALFERNWPYAWTLHQDESSPVKKKIGIAPLPHFNVPDAKSISTLGGWHIGISKYSDAKTESFEFLKYIVSYDVQKRLAIELGWNPGREDIYIDGEIAAKLPHFLELKEIFENTYPRPAVPYYTIMSETIMAALNGVLSNSVNAEDALLDAEDAITDILNIYETNYCDKQ